MTARSHVLASVLGAAAATLPFTAGAQTPSYATRDETIRGTISSVENINHIFVADDRGYTDDVTLREGAKVMSNGVRLEPGARVTIVGSNGGRTFLASRITTQGRSLASEGSDGTAAAAYAVPVPAYYPAPVYYPAYYPAPYYSGFSVALGFGFGRYGYGFRHGYRSPYGGYGRGYRPYYGGYGRSYRSYGGYRPASLGAHVRVR